LTLPASLAASLVLSGGIVNGARVLEREVRREAHDVCGDRPTGTTV
jgi:hypothetical protein